MPIELKSRESSIPACRSLRRSDAVCRRGAKAVSAIGASRICRSTASRSSAAASAATSTPLASGCC
eukprot:3876119-Prymnesium_polylepis.1